MICARLLQFSTLAVMVLMAASQAAVAQCVPSPIAASGTVVCSGNINTTLTNTVSPLSSVTVQILAGTNFNANPSIVLSSIDSLNVVNSGGNLNAVSFSDIGALTFEHTGNLNGTVTVDGPGNHTIINHSNINGVVTFDGAGDASNDVLINQGTLNNGLVKNSDGSLFVLNTAGRFINNGIDVNGTGPTSIDNAGTLQGGSGVMLGAGNDTIINRATGTINGNVDQAGGYDTFIMQGGRVNGAIAQGAGEDQMSILAGEITGTVSAGADNDNLLWSGGLVGGIDMGSGTDKATLRSLSQSNLRNIEIDGGPGANDTLTFETTQADNPARLDNWELIALGSRSSLTMNSDLTLGDAGTGTGALTIDATSTLFAGDGHHAIVPFNPANLATVVNAGTIDLTNGPPSTSDSLRIEGNYVGLGGMLNLNSVLNSDGSPSDRLIIDGGNASGSTGIYDMNLNGPGNVTQANGIMVVDAINGATANARSFYLANPGGYAAAGPYAYTLYRGSVAAGDADDWYLRSTIDCVADPSNLACRIPPPGPQGPPGTAPNIRPDVSLYAAVPPMVIIYGRQILDTLHERMGQQAAPGSIAEGSPYAWGRVIGTHGEHDGDWRGILGDGPRFSYDMFAVQAGLDAYRNVDTTGQRDRVGFYIAVGDSSGNVRHYDQSDAGHNSFQAFTFGAYWTYYTPGDAYLDAVLQGIWYDAVATSMRVPNLSTGGPGLGASLEGGVPVIEYRRFIVEPQAQLVFQAVSLKDGTDTAANVKFRDLDSLLARGGIRFAYTWPQLSAAGPLTLWVRPNLWYELLGKTKTALSSANGDIPFLAELEGSSVEINTGLTAPLTESTTIYANASYLIGISQNAGGREYDGKLGIKVAW